MKNKEELINYWLTTSELDFEAAENLMESKKFPHALFFGHLSLEKLLKALFIKKTNDYPPRTHNLVMLSKQIYIEIPSEIEDQLIAINSFNIEARYPDEKFEFYKKCSENFSKKHFIIIKDIRSWLKMKL